MSKILILEDEEAIADLEKDYLELSDFEVEIEHNGEKGLKNALKNDFDLIILDIMLPGMDGFEVCKRIREKKDVPILMGCFPPPLAAIPSCPRRQATTVRRTCCLQAFRSALPPGRLYC